ncbi:MAG: formyltransferase family protein [Gemmatimonadota bacterium]
MMQQPLRPVRPIVFAYDFPHKKTQDFILALVANGHRPSAVIAAPFQSLPVPPPALRVKARHIGLLEPSALCAALGIEYLRMAHDSTECLLHLDVLAPQVGVVAGARILPSDVLERFPHGVINLHPGLLPVARGLDALQWSLYRGLPLGVTAHLIDARVDAGWLLASCIVDELPDDTLVDLSLRLYEKQLEMLRDAVVRATTVRRDELSPLVGGSYNRSFPASLVPQLREKVRARRRLLRRGGAVYAEGTGATAGALCP